MSTPITGVRYWYDGSAGQYGGFVAPGRPTLLIDLSVPEYDTFVPYVTKPATNNVGSRIPKAQLTRINGDYIVTTPGVTVAGLNVKGRIIVRAANVTVEDCIVENQVAPTATVNVIDTTNSAARNTVVRFCEASSADAPSVYINGIGPKSVTVSRCYIHDVVDGSSVSDSTGNNDPVIIETSLIEKFLYITPDPTHSDNRTHDDGVQSQGGPSVLRIRGNTIIGRDAGPTGYAISCVMLNTTTARFKSRVEVLDNWLDGGTDTVNGRGTDGGVVEIKRNKFSRARSGQAITTNISLSTQWDVPVSGPDVNVYEDNNAPLSQTAPFVSGGNTIRRYY